MLGHELTLAVLAIGVSIVTIPAYTTYITIIEVEQNPILRIVHTPESQPKETAPPPPEPKPPVTPTEEGSKSETTVTKEMEETIKTDTSPPPQNGGGCLIATATYGSELAPQVQQLRELRDNYLLKTESGNSFMTGFNQFYYSFSPTIADLERQSPVFKEAVKLTITPLVSSLSILNYVDMDSEAEVLGYGIGLILLNVGMYFVAPVSIGIVIARKFRIFKS